MNVYILRHGEVSHEALTDRERPLSDDGKKAIDRTAKYFTDAKIQLTKIITSPLLRAWQTAQIIGDNLKISDHIQESDFLLSESNPADIIRELKNFRDDEKVLLVGHQPFLSLLTAILIGNTAEKIGMRTSSLACVEIQQPIVEGKGALKDLINFQ
ncbi:MAG: phosphohistidine phosphatase SixA [Bacteroidota bacterium]|nr:phosphohistidine phosphatase SixA [Bacteroidota bacterium]